jgi:nicotinamide phosphoribosyltransferase
MNKNIIMMTDSYKISHHKQYPPGTERVYSYFEARTSEDKVFPETVFFGLQYYLKEYLKGKVVTKEYLEEADSIFSAHFQNPNLFNRKGWQYILDRHEGKLPLSIKAVPEGTIVPRGNVLMTIENTDPECYWLTNYIETILVQAWYGSTVATQSRDMKMVLLNALDIGGDPLTVDFKLHDFGFRGVSSIETAGVGGAAHLVSFKGTDNIAGLLVARDYYDCPMAGFSIPAAEHSTITSWGKENEKDAYANMLEQYPEGMVAVVSDSYDIFKACKDIWGTQLKNKVLERNGTTIIRPDSGNPMQIIPTILDILGKTFGYTVNKKGYKVLNPKVRVIQGDGIDMKTMNEIIRVMMKVRWSPDNIAFGSGGGLLQKMNRDTCNFAFKCSSITVDKQERDVFKQPITQNKKNSKKGRFKLVYNDADKLITVPATDSREDELIEVFKNGEILVEQNFEEIRTRAFVE